MILYSFQIRNFVEYIIIIVLLISTIFICFYYIFYPSWKNTVVWTLEVYKLKIGTQTDETLSNDNCKKHLNSSRNSAEIPHEKCRNSEWTILFPSKRVSHLLLTFPLLVMWLCVSHLLLTFPLLVMWLCVSHLLLTFPLLVMWLCVSHLLLTFPLLVMWLTRCASSECNACATRHRHVTDNRNVNNSWDNC